MRAGAAVAVVGVAAAIAVPNVLGDTGEPRLARPATPSPPADPTAMRPELIVGPDRADELALPAPLSGDPETPTGLDEKWRLSGEQATTLCWDAQPDDADGDVDRDESLVVVSLVTMGAAHEANVSDVVPVLLTAYGPHGERALRREVLGLDADDGSVLWTQSVRTLVSAPCQVAGRGAHVVCRDDAVGPDGEPSPGVTVLASETGRSVTDFTTASCAPVAFLQVDHRLFWAGSNVLDSSTCLGGGSEHFATLPVDDSQVTYESLTRAATGPLLRTRGASVMLTEAGWRGYDGRVEPGPPGVVVREVASEGFEGPDGEWLEPVTTVVSDIDGATLMSVSGKPWQRHDLMPDAAADARMANLVGIGTSAYEVDGTRRLTLRTDEGPLTVPAYMPGPTILPDGVRSHHHRPDDQGYAVLGWSFDEAFGDAAGQITPDDTWLSPTVVGTTTLRLEGLHATDLATAVGTLQLVTSDLVLGPATGSPERTTVELLVGLGYTEPGTDDFTGGMYLEIAAEGAYAVVVGHVVVTSDALGLVALS